jgi:D-3-phosphoglycerate dehydrogenase
MLPGLRSMCLSEEPATENVLFGAPNLVCTPHLGAATTEAQENVALQVAEQMADFLTTGAVTNALNSPSISAEKHRAQAVRQLAELIGSFAGQLTETAIEASPLNMPAILPTSTPRRCLRRRWPVCCVRCCRPSTWSLHLPSPRSGIAVEETKRGEGRRLRDLYAVDVVTERQSAPLPAPCLPMASHASSRSKASTWTKGGA